MGDAADRDKSSGFSGLLWDLSKTYIPPVAGAAAAFVLYPFDWLACLVAAVLVLGCVLMARKAKHLQQIQRRFLPWRIGSALAGFAVLPWIAVAPIVGLKPIYTCISSKTEWTGTFSEPLDANGRRVATLLFIADPIRKSQVFHEMTGWLAGKRLREIHAISNERHRYYEMPLIFALRKSVPTPSASTEQEEIVKVVYQGLSVGIGVTIVDGTLLLGEAVGINHTALVVSSNRKSRPWQMVSVNGADDETFRYAVRLDFALTAINEGDYSTALGLLDDAGTHAPSPLEKARSLVVMAQLTSMVLSDSIGTLQALSLYNEAYQTWHDATAKSKATDTASESLDGWIKAQLDGEFESYGSAYPEVTRALALNPKTVQTMEALRFQRERGKAIADPSEATAAFNSLNERLRKSMSSDYAQTWFDAERERLARLDSSSLMEEAKQAISRGPEEARWFAETLIELYAGGMADNARDGISSAIGIVADGCNEPWRTQFKEYLSTIRELSPTRHSSSSEETLRYTIKLAESFGFEKTARVFREMLATAHSGTSAPSHLAEPPPSAAWWTREYLDWFLDTMWTVTSASSGKCDVVSPSCEEMLFRMRSYMFYDGSERRRLFAPGLGLAMWMLARQPKVDPYWDHAFYFGTGTHFALWQRGL